MRPSVPLARLLIGKAIITEDRGNPLVLLDYDPEMKFYVRLTDARGADDGWFHSRDIQKIEYRSGLDKFEREVANRMGNEIGRDMRAYDDGRRIGRNPMMVSNRSNWMLVGLYGSKFAVFPENN